MIGETVGDYRILSVLGEGGMGRVYLAEHTRLCRKAALKILRPALSASAAAVERLLAEARATALVRHPSVVEVFDCDVHRDGRAYLAMEYLPGETLAARLAARGGAGLPPDAALALAALIAGGLAAAHARGLVHRDIKPDNVFLVYDGAAPVKVLDFGVARFIGGAAPGAGRDGAFVGTPAYMSPEQCRGAGEVGPAADVYSLGCVLFETLCGRPPFVRASPGELLAAHLLEPPPRASSFTPGVSAEVDRLLARALAKAPGDRQAGMAALREDLLGCLGVSPAELEAVLGRSAAIAEGRRSWQRRPRPAAAREPRAGRQTVEMRTAADTFTPAEGVPAAAVPAGPARRRWLVVALAVSAVVAARPLGRKTRLPVATALAPAPVRAPASVCPPAAAPPPIARAAAPPIARVRPHPRRRPPAPAPLAAPPPRFEPMPD